MKSRNLLALLGIAGAFALVVGCSSSDSDPIAAGGAGGGTAGAGGGTAGSDAGTAGTGGTGGTAGAAGAAGSTADAGACALAAVLPATCGACVNEKCMTDCNTCATDTACAGLFGCVLPKCPKLDLACIASSDCMTTYADGVTNATPLQACVAASCATPCGM